MTIRQVIIILVSVLTIFTLAYVQAGPKLFKTTDPSPSHRNGEDDSEEEIRTKGKKGSARKHKNKQPKKAKTAPKKVVVLEVKKEEPKKKEVKSKSNKAQKDNKTTPKKSEVKETKQVKPDHPTQTNIKSK